MLNLSQSDLSQFELDEMVILAFASASGIGNPLPCRTTRQKLASSCSLTRPVDISTYTGNEKAIMLFLLFETALMITLAAVVRYCFLFWNKKKLQTHGLGKFLEKRNSLRLQKKAFDRTISELQKKATEEAADNDVLEKLGNVIKERESIVRKLSTTYSLGRDRDGSRSNALLPLCDRKARSFSFQGLKRESVTIFHTLSATPSDESSEGLDEDSSDNEASTSKGKGKELMEVQSSSDDDIYEKDHQSRLFASASTSRVHANPLFIEPSLNNVKRRNAEGEKMENGGNGSKSIRRRTLSSTN